MIHQFHTRLSAHQGECHRPLDEKGHCHTKLSVHPLLVFNLSPVGKISMWLFNFLLDHVTSCPLSLQRGRCAGYKSNPYPMAPTGTILHPHGTNPLSWQHPVHTPSISLSLPTSPLTMGGTKRGRRDQRSPHPSSWDSIRQKRITEPWLTTVACVPFWLQKQPVIAPENHRPLRHSFTTHNSRCWNAKTSANVQTQSFKTQTAAAVGQWHPYHSCKRHVCFSWLRGQLRFTSTGTQS